MKKHVVWLSTMAVTLALSAAPASGQQAQEAGVIVGEVVDASERPIAGANVTVTGTARGSTTDADGRFRITGISPGERIVRTQRIGFQAMTQEVMVVAGETANVRISLEPSAIDLDEIVVTGRAGRSDRRAQGAVISSVNAADITEKAPVSTMADLLQGRTPSVSLTQSSGTTGTAQRIRIRGGASINLNNDPLIYIDGVRADSRSDANHFTGGQVMSRLNDLNPNDVESIEIVKGPAAATLYGAEASVGVIQIITKRGRPGQPLHPEPQLRVQAEPQAFLAARQRGPLHGGRYAERGPDPVFRAGAGHGRAGQSAQPDQPVPQRGQLRPALERPRRRRELRLLHLVFGRVRGRHLAGQRPGSVLGTHQRGVGPHGATPHRFSARPEPHAGEPAGQ